MHRRRSEENCTALVVASRVGCCSVVAKSHSAIVRIHCNFHFAMVLNHFAVDDVAENNDLRENVHQRDVKNRNNFLRAIVCLLLDRWMCTRLTARRTCCFTW